MAGRLVALAATGIMTNGCRRPQVVHRPHDRLTGVEYSADAVQRKHALVYPLQVNNVSFLEITCMSNVDTGIGNVYLKKMLTTEVQVEENTQPFPKERPLSQPRMTNRRNGYLICFLVTNKHASLHAVIVQRIHQPVGSNSCAAGLL